VPFLLDSGRRDLPIASALLRINGCHSWAVSDCLSSRVGTAIDPAAGREGRPAGAVVLDIAGPRFLPERKVFSFSFTIPAHYLLPVTAARSDFPYRRISSRARRGQAGQRRTLRSTLDYIRPARAWSTLRSTLDYRPPSRGQTYPWDGAQPPGACHSGRRRERPVIKLPWSPAPFVSSAASVSLAADCCDTIRCVSAFPSQRP